MSELFPTSSDQSSAQPALAYRVLARKYRPSTFAELIGQEAMVRTLTNAIMLNRLPQAWMLTGVRGVGKTTTARLVARALNCTGRKAEEVGNIEPCGVCDSCKAIAEDRHVDVLEMDAASRTSVDDIRDIIDGVRYGPVSAKYKIYILDEVHMLSKNAFNALLKTLEEPPPHTKFIFATTEIRKVPITVLSRCQRFDLKRIDSEQLVEHFAGIAKTEKVEAEAEALKLIAVAADGSVRDGLSLLDQAIARGDGQIKTADVQDMLGLADKVQSLHLGHCLLRGQMPEALGAFNGMVQAGTDPSQVLRDLCDLVHLLTRGQVVPDFQKKASLTEAERNAMTELADVKIPALTRTWQILIKGLGEVQVAPNPAQAAEMVLIRLAYAAALPPPADLIKSLKEKGFGSGAPSSSGAPSGGGNGGGATVGFMQSAIGQNSGAQSAAAPQFRPVAVVPMAQPQDNVDPNPANYLELVALFENHREGALVATLRNDVHAVRCDAGFLEMRLASDVAPDFVNRVSLCLSRWTGRRWMVSVSSEEGQPTLVEQERLAEAARRERISAHPLMAATMKVFPDAVISEVRQKVALQKEDRQDDALQEAADSLLTDNIDFEDA